MCDYIENIMVFVIVQGSREPPRATNGWPRAQKNQRALADGRVNRGMVALSVSQRALRNGRVNRGMVALTPSTV